jgi:hypothetical protein
MPPTLETQAIDDAFVATLTRAYEVLQAAYIAAEGDAPSQTRADEKFKALVQIARTVRQRALSQL